MERKPFEQRFASLKQEASTWISIWKDIRNYISPTRGFFEGDQANRGKAIDHRTILDGTPLRAADNFANGLAAHLTSPSRPWWRPTIDDLDLMEFEPVKLWLGEVEKRMCAVQSGSNIYNALHTDYGELGAFATSAMAVLEDRQDVMRGRNFTIGEYYIGCGADDRPNAFAMKYKRTVGQLVEEYGKNKVSQRVRVLYEKGSIDEWIDCIYVIQPNVQREQGKVDNRNMPWVAVVWEEGSAPNTFLDVSGFNEFPILVSRWNVTGQNVWGNGSPGWTTLGDAKMLQKLRRDELIGVEKVMDPPMQGDGTVDGNAITLPGGFTRSSAVQPNMGVRPAYQIQPDFAAIEGVIKATQQALREGHFENLFLMLTMDQEAGRTAQEIVQRNSERLTMLGPLVERLYHEKLSPLIRRQFNIMWRAGVIPEPPPELEGRVINVELISVLAQAQKAVGTRAIDEMLTVVGAMAQGGYPNAADMIDGDEAIRVRSNMIGLPPKIIRAPEIVSQMRDARAKQQQQAAAADQLERTAQVAKTASETKLGQGSALDALAGEPQ